MHLSYGLDAIFLRVCNEENDRHNVISIANTQPNRYNKEKRIRLKTLEQL